jgi:hypothetical protein
VLGRDPPLAAADARVFATLFELIEDLLHASLPFPARTEGVERGRGRCKFA